MALARPCFHVRLLVMLEGLILLAFERVDISDDLFFPLRAGSNRDSRFRGEALAIKFFREEFHAAFILQRQFRDVEGTTRG